MYILLNGKPTYWLRETHKNKGTDVIGFFMVKGVPANHVGDNYNLDFDHSSVILTL